MNEEKERRIIVTTIGGGTGSFHLLLALKKIPNVVINAIVSMSDDGGSSGFLRTVYGILPPGDVRNCLVALSDNVSIWAKLFNYRFDENLQKHSLGNLILTSLIHITGSFENALDIAHKMLNITLHRVIPITFDSLNLVAVFEDGKKVIGESQITKYAFNYKKRIKELLFDTIPLLNPKVLDVIMNSDFIVIAPGSLYTSILSNFLFDNVQKALKSTKAKKIFVVNVMSDAETYNFNLNDFINVIEQFVPLDYILVNSKKPNESLLKKYRKELKSFVEIDVEDDRIIKADLINESNIIRHDPEKLSRSLYLIFLQSLYKL